jgi:hypothetical protein
MRARTLHLLTLVGTLSLAAACGDKDDDFDTAAATDGTAPVITLVGDDPLMVAYGGTFTDPGATATDDTDPMVDVIVSGEVDTSVLGDVIVSYDAVDSAGNEADTVTRTVTVADMTGPVITLVGDNPLSLVEGGTFEDPGATATDDVDADVTVTVTGSVDPELSGSYTLSYDAVDSAGNAAETVERVVEVVFEGQLALASNGAALMLIAQRSDGTLIERASADIDLGEAVYNDNFMIFSVAIDPATGDAYTTSKNQCGEDEIPMAGCWGNARIDRFSFDATSITHEGAAMLIQAPVRLLDVVGDETSTEVTVPLLNQGTTDLEITSATLDSDDGGTLALVSGCDAMTLAPGDTCELTISTSGTDGISAFVSIETSVGTMSSAVYWDEWHEVYVASGELSLGDEDEDVALPSCALEDWGYPRQVGACGPTALAFSPDGSRVYVNEDRNDQGLVLAAEGDGTLSYLSVGERRSIRQQGIAVSGDGAVVYNGDNAFTTADDELVQTHFGDGGNATEVMEFDGTEVLVSTIRNSGLEIFDLSVPTEPSLIAAGTPTSSTARFQHHNLDGSRFVTVDHEDLSVFSFDGEALSELASLEIPVDLGEATCGEDEECVYHARNRSVQMSADGSQVMTGVFAVAWEEDGMDALPFWGQLRSFDIDGATGVATEVDSLEFQGTTRTVLIVPAAE